MKSERFWVAVWHENQDGSLGHWIHLHENPFLNNESVHVVVSQYGALSSIKQCVCSIVSEYAANSQRRAGFLDIQTGELFRDTDIEERLRNGHSEV